jgi:uncharacterized membrane protein
MNEGQTGDVPVTPPPWRRLGARLRGYLVAGVLVTAPIGVTLYLAWSIISFFDTHVRSVVPDRYNPESYLPIAVPGIGLLVVLVGLILVGWLAAGLVGRFVVGLGERLVQRTPVVRSIYGFVKQVIETTMSQRGGSFRQVVLVEFPRKGAWTIGFVTGTPNDEIRRAGEDLISVFCPTSPNPTSGYLIFVPRRDAIVLSMSVEDGLKLVVSGGIAQSGAGQPERK